MTVKKNKTNRNLSAFSPKPAPLYRQERADAWNGIRNALLQIYLLIALLICGWTMAGSLAGSSPESAISLVHGAGANLTAPAVKTFPGFAIAAH